MSKQEPPQQKAKVVMKDHFPTTHPVRLSYALNTGHYYYEFLNRPEDAVKLAKSAFDDALEDLDTLTEESYLESIMLLQLL
jgi:archaellum biogenesis protein FlaJ (TadC family)